MTSAAYTNFYQGVASGGEEQRFRNGGKLDLFMIADTKKLGLWEGGTLIVHAVDWQIGQNSIDDAAGMAPVNLNLLTPLPEASFGLTNLLYTHKLRGDWVGQIGRFNALDFWTKLYPDYGRGIDGFMQASLMVPMNIIPSLPKISNVAGIAKMGERALETAFVVIESQNSPTTAGLDFPNGVSLMGTTAIFTDFRDLPGNHRLVGAYATGDFTSFDTSGWEIIPEGGVVPTTNSGTWMASYMAEQRLWADPCNAKRYGKLYGHVGFSDQENSPYKVTFAVTAEQFGLLDSRPNDRMGIGYFYSALNDDFKNAYALTTTPVDDLQGGEVYYNAQVTPWFNMTVDLQAVEPAVQSQDTAVVLGVRANTRF
ncbi:MAG: hypothetical protein HKN37_14215 [Rhodothermales bacterium]|nr:hypothetical protein [Rhodothermales bacterium]